MVVQTRNNSISKDNSQRTILSFKKPLSISSTGPSDSSSSPANGKCYDLVSIQYNYRGYKNHDKRYTRYGEKR